MKKLIAYYGDSPEYVDDFSKDCERSCEGSLHLIPRKPITVTEGELEHLKKKHSNLRIRIIAEKAPEDPKPKKDAEVAKEPKAKSKPKKAKAPAKKVKTSAKKVTKSKKKSAKGRRKKN